MAEIPLFDPPLTEGEQARISAYRESTRCPECRRTRKSHWPYCSQATPEQRREWKRRKQLRDLRTAERVTP